MYFIFCMSLKKLVAKVRFLWCSIAGKTSGSRVK
nr:MAG TPA: hypothetical protein [Caudoviricetes sp.]DAS40567.1 MAG TPA: hypothetical protein [Caudoviricetes sp.]DAY42767.1 MAG TPA: hypothetical protein [Caudoviricetes sp.]